MDPKTCLRPIQANQKEKHRSVSGNTVLSGLAIAHEIAEGVTWQL